MLDRGPDRDRIVAGVAALGAVAASIGTTMTWFTIVIGGVAAPGGSVTGLEGHDGWTVLGGAAAAVLAAGFVLARRRPMAAKVLLLVAGGVTTIVAVAGIVDATSKDQEVEQAFGIPADRVSASVGSGLWLVALGGAGELAAGAATRAGASASAAERAGPSGARTAEGPAGSRRRSPRPAVSEPG